MFGRKARLPTDIVYGTTQSNDLPVDNFVKDLSVVLENAYQRVCTTMGLKQDCRKELYDHRKILSDKKFSMASFSCCP